MSMTIPKAVGYFELGDGTEEIGYRVTLKTKIQAGKTSRANGWDNEKDASVVAAFMSWHAAKEASLTSLGWDEFRDAVVDAGVLQLEEDDTEERPTQPAA